MTIRPYFKAQYAGSNLPSTNCNQATDCSGSLALPNGIYTITAKHSNKSLDVENWQTNDGANIQQWTCNDMEVQQFCLQDMGNGYQLKNNPSSDGNFVIESDYIDQNTKVMVYDLQGRRLFEKDYADKRRISVEANLPAGVYLVAVVNSHNRAALKLEVK